MMDWWQTLLKSRTLLWSAIGVLTVVDGAGLYHMFNSRTPEAPPIAPAPAKPATPEKPPPPAMIEPPAVATVLKSGTLIVISKSSQTMFVFRDGMPWASTPISSGKRRHETPSGVFPILQKNKFHRSNLYSNAPMPFMQRLTWDGIALHAGHVPGYPASHGCIRMPHAFAEALFKLTKASATTVVIGDAPLTTEMQAQQFALVNNLPVRAALAPKPDPKPADLAGTVGTPSRKVLAVVPLKPVPPLPASTTIGCRR
jgi:lipoprotein-anchoring transpeptidase ErfK/SrfK